MLFMGKLTISMTIFKSHVSLPEGNFNNIMFWKDVPNYLIPFRTALNTPTHIKGSSDIGVEVVRFCDLLSK